MSLEQNGGLLPIMSNVQEAIETISQTAAQPVTNQLMPSPSSKGSATPEVLLRSTYPNPFNSIVNIPVTVRGDGNMGLSVVIYDLLGQRAKTILGGLWWRGCAASLGMEEMVPAGGFWSVSSGVEGGRARAGTQGGIGALDAVQSGGRLKCCGILAEGFG